MISIIIVNYKNEKKTIDYVKEELIKVKIKHIIVIVNNESSHKSNKILSDELNAELISDISFKPNLKNSIFIISSKSNLGYAKGNNYGANFSILHFNITHFLFTNNDIRFIDNNVVDELFYKIQSMQDVALIGPKVIGLNGKNQSPEPYYKFWNRYIWAFWISPFLNANLKEKFFKYNYSQNALEGQHYKVMGSFFLVNSNDFIKCNMMDPNTFLFAEEVILTERLNTINKKVYYYPKFSVLHEHSQTISLHMNNEIKSWQQFKSESYYYSKYKNTYWFSILIGKTSLFFYLKLKKIYSKIQ